MGPVSSTGRSMMASLNNAVRQGMPVDQAIAYVKSMAKDGVAPLVDLYAMLNQYQRLQQQQMKPPQTPPTIRDNLNMMEAAQQPQMAQGLGGLNAGVMENAQFAGGGIIAFQEGGLTEAERQELTNLRRLSRSGRLMELFSTFGGAAGIGAAVPERTPPTGITSALYENQRRRLEELTRKEEAEIRAAQEAEKKLAMAKEAEKYGLTLEDIATEEPASEEPASEEPVSEEPEVAVPPRPVAEREAARAIPDFTAPERAAIQKQIAELQGATPKSRAERYREAGIEDVIPGQIERIRQEMGGLESEKARDRYLALAEAGFGMASAAAKPGAKFLGALGEGATTGTRRLNEINKEYRGLRSALMGKIDEMERYRQGRLEGQIDRDIEKETKLTEDVNRLQLSLAKLDTEMGKFRETAELTREGREMQRETKDRLEAAYAEAVQKGDTEEAERILNMLKDLAKASTGYLTAEEQARARAASAFKYPIPPNAGQEDPELKSLLDKYGG